MSACTASIQPFHPIPLDDELAALSLQLEELGFASASGKGKHPIDHPPDFELAFSSFQAELEEYKTFLGDQKFAQSMGAAVHTDGAIIGDLTAQEIQSHADHRFVLQLSNDDPEIEKPPRVLEAQDVGNIEDWMSTVTGTMAAQSVVDFSDDENEAGPSRNFAESQADTLKKLSMEFQCTACTDWFPRARIVAAQCEHRYCANCVNIIFMRSTKDQSLYPPKCCKKPIPLALVARHMNAVDLATFQLAVVEFATPHPVYCSNVDCARFIVPGNVNSGLHRADCSECSTETCTICRSGYHYGLDCPDDPSLRQTRELAAALGWQTCQACNRVVELRTGCNHMTCKCSAQFCYVCGVEWKNCSCATADINRIEERAAEIVRRDEPANILPHERRVRIDQVFAELQDNHECEHSRRFERREWNMPRRGFRCEMCDARHWKYILRCRQCHISVCEECRRHRI